MALAKQLANRLKEVLLEGKWVTGTNIKNEIIDLDWKLAIAKVDSLNSIADLVFHINYYITGVLNVFEGGNLEIKDKFSFDYDPISSKEEWEELRNKFCTDSERFIKAVEVMTDDDLLKVFVDDKYGNYYRNIDVLIEHSYYHFGQIMLIKKMIKNKVE